MRSGISRAIYLVTRKTANNRLARNLTKVRDWCHKRMRAPVAQQSELLDKRGHQGLHF